MERRKSRRFYVLVYNCDPKPPCVPGRKGQLVEYSATYVPLYVRRDDAEFDAKHHMQGEADVQPVTMALPQLAKARA